MRWLLATLILASAAAAFTSVYAPRELGLEAAWFPREVTRGGEAVDRLFREISIVMAVVLALTAVLLAAGVWRGAARRAGEGSTRAGSVWLEVAWTLVPAAVLAGLLARQLEVRRELAAPSASLPSASLPIASQPGEASPSGVPAGEAPDAPTGDAPDQPAGEAPDSPTPAPPAFRVGVDASQFEWRFRYPGPDGELFGSDDVVSLSELALPAGSLVELRLRSRDVIHSFFAPALRTKRDVLPGRETVLRFVIDPADLGPAFARTGESVLALECAELCGFGHAAMIGRIRVLADPRLEARLAELAAERIAVD